MQINNIKKDIINILVSMVIIPLFVFISCGGSGSTGSTPSSYNVNLESLGISSGSLSPSFSPNVSSYTLEVDNSIASLGFTPVISDVSSNLKINGQDVVSGDIFNIALVTGQNTITIVVSTNDSLHTQSYIVVVTRLSGLSLNSYLSSLSLSSCKLSPYFDKNIVSYNCH